MLNKKDNRFLDALNNIYDDLVDEVTDDSIRPRRVGQIKKRSWLGRAALGFASLASMAAVCVGVVYVMRDLPTTPPGETLEGTSAFSENSDNSESTDNSISEQTQPNTEPPVVTTEPAPPPVIRHTFVDELLEQEEWQNIDSYVNAADEEGYSQIAQLNGFNVADLDNETGMTTGVLFDRKPFKFGYEIALLGFKAWKDDINAYADTVVVGELRIALVKSGRIEAAMPVYDPISPDSPVYLVEKRYFDKYTELLGNIVVFRSLSNRRIPEALFFNIQMKHVSSDGEGKVDYEYRISQSWRSDVPDGSKREDRSEILSPVICISEANITTTEGSYEAFIIGDELTETEYWFVGDTYTVEQKDRLHNEFKPFDLDSIPVIEEFFYDDIEDLMGTFAHYMIISKKQVGEYTLWLVGNNFWRTEGGVIYFYNPQTIITKGIYHYAAIPTAVEEMKPYHCAMIYSDNGDYSRYEMNAFMLGDNLFLFDNNDQSRYDEAKIYCFNGDYTYVLDGNYDGVSSGEPLLSNAVEEGYDLIVDEDSLSFVYGFRRFRLEIGENGEYRYRVSWLEKPVD